MTGNSGIGALGDTISEFDHIIVSVGTSAVEAKVSASRLKGRQMLLFYNFSDETIYMGKSSVTTTGVTRGIPLLSGQWAGIMITDNSGWYLIAGSASNDVFVLEGA